ncbi:MAG TPA: arsenate reductase ArsC [Polyangia bacterium]
MVQRRDIRHLGKLDIAVAGPAPRGVLFLCVGNSARSQMAEGWARRLFPAGVKVFSAGSQPAARVNPHAVAAMAEVGIDLAGHRPKPLSEVPADEVDLVVTLCAEEVCPAGLLARPHDSWALPDPAAVPEGSSAIDVVFRRVRDELRRRVELMVAGWR